mmetsp:Transcript_11038/g.29382  ORF Transcript_11038/g.29382 Transcript_11038/m.29382 type:complete len:305 (-) Transcript_11038:231-1145(-)
MPALVADETSLVMLQNLLAIATVGVGLHDHVVEFISGLARDGCKVDLGINLHAHIMDCPQLCRHLPKTHEPGQRTNEAFAAAASRNHAHLFELGANSETRQRMPIPRDALVVSNCNHDQVDSTFVVACMSDASDFVLRISHTDGPCSLSKSFTDIFAQRSICGDIMIGQVHHKLIQFGFQRVRVRFDTPSGNELRDDCIHGPRQACPRCFFDLKTKALLSSHFVSFDRCCHDDSLLLIDEKLSRSRLLDGGNIATPACQPKKGRCFRHQQALDSFGLHQLPGGNNVLNILWRNAVHCHPRYLNA